MGEVKERILRLSWKKILSIKDADVGENLEEEPTASCQDNDPSTEQFQSHFEMLGQDLDEHEINEWLNEDCNDNGYEHMSDAEIIAEVLQSNESDGETSMAEQEETITMSTLISHSEAVKTMDSCIDWFQQQSKANVYSLGVLHEVRELAARKCLATITQTKLTSPKKH